jgi:hypothetical protein
MSTLLDVSIPTIGWVVLVLGLVLVVFAPRALYAAMVFVVPFSATTVLNFGDPASSDAFGVQAAIYLGALWIAREAVTGLPKRIVRAPTSVRTCLLLLGVFLGIAFVSLAMPFAVGEGFLTKVSAGANSFTPLRLTMHNLTQAAYLGYGIAVAAVIGVRAVDATWRALTVRALFAGGIALCLWGWVQLVVLLAGRSYPHEVLNTTVQPQAQNWDLTLDLSFGTVHRLSSAAVEPSIFAQVVLAIIALVVVVVLRGHVVFSRRWDIAALIMMTAVLLLSTATTAYVGLAFIGLVVGVARVSKTGIRRQDVGIVFASGLVLAATCLGVRPVREVFQATLLDKLDSWSAQTRWSTATDAWWNFVEDPILGTGWASAPTHDLVVFLLANTGLVGTMAFLVLGVYVFIGVHRSIRLGHDDASVALALGTALSLGTLLFVNVLTGFAFVFGHVWVVLGLAIACAGLSARDSGPSTVRPDSVETRDVDRVARERPAEAAQPSGETRR